MTQASMPQPAARFLRFGNWLTATTSTKASLLQAAVIAVALTTILTVLSYQITGAVNWVEVASVATSFATVWLCVKQTRWNYPVNVVSVILLAYVFWDAQLYGSMALNLYLIAPLIYGWFVWGKDKETKPVQHVRWKWLPVYMVATLITWAGAAAIITALGGQLSALDGWLLVGSILAQYLLDRKKIETWMVWVLVNIVSIYVYFQAELTVLSLQYGLFLLNAIAAYFIWKKSMASKTSPEPQLIGAPS